MICYLCIFCILEVSFFGYYGLMCELKCEGSCKNNEFCNYSRGLCNKWCYDGLIGENCREGKYRRSN